MSNVDDKERNLHQDKLHTHTRTNSSKSKVSNLPLLFSLSHSFYIVRSKKLLLMAQIVENNGAGREEERARCKSDRFWTRDSIRLEWLQLHNTTPYRRQYWHHRDHYLKKPMNHSNTIPKLQSNIHKIISRVIFVRINFPPFSRSFTNLLRGREGASERAISCA